jgi:hypothetical protein
MRRPGHHGYAGNERKIAKLRQRDGDEDEEMQIGIIDHVIPWSLTHDNSMSKETKMPIDSREERSMGGL